MVMNIEKVNEMGFSKKDALVSVQELNVWFELDDSVLAMPGMFVQWIMSRLICITGKPSQLSARADAVNPL